MKQLVYIFTAIFLVLTACSEDENVSLRTETDNDEKVEVAFGLSVENTLHYGTEYVPMKAAGDETIVRTDNLYRAILFKKFDGYWIIDSLLSLPLTDAASYARLNLTQSIPLKPISLVLRPGDYHLTVITNPNYVNWPSYIYEGSILQIDESNPQQLCGYMTGTESYPVNERYYLGAEIFSGHTSFTVKKQEDLHGQAPAPLQMIELIRRVGRFRIVLQNDPSAGDRNFGMGYLGEQVVSEMAADNDVFCNGLDLWGNPYYDAAQPIRQMMYCSMSPRSPYPSTNGEAYFLPSSNSRTFAVHFFTQPGRDIEFTMSQIESTVRSGDPYHIYIGEIPGLKIQDNKINGIVFKPGPRVQGSDYEIEMILETDDLGQPASSVPLFSPSAEYLQ